MSPWRARLFETFAFRGFGGLKKNPIKAWSENFLSISVIRHMLQSLPLPRDLSCVENTGCAQPHHETQEYVQVKFPPFCRSLRRCPCISRTANVTGQAQTQWCLMFVSAHPFVDAKTFKTLSNHVGKIGASVTLLEPNSSMRHPLLADQCKTHLINSSMVRQILPLANQMTTIPR